jgi:chaperonin cofactor prefoldin
MLGELESRISAKVEELKSVDDKTVLIKEIGLLLVERNKKCKILK